MKLELLSQGWQYPVSRAGRHRWENNAYRRLFRRSNWLTVPIPSLWQLEILKFVNSLTLSGELAALFHLWFPLHKPKRTKLSETYRRRGKGASDQRQPPGKQRNISMWFFTSTQQYTRYSKKQLIHHLLLTAHSTVWAADGCPPGEVIQSHAIRNSTNVTKKTRHWRLYSASPDHLCPYFSF